MNVIQKFFIFGINSRTLLSIFCAWSVLSPNYLCSETVQVSDDLLGPKVGIKTIWKGTNVVKQSTLEILVLAGHADSQGLAGAGTSGAAVDLKGADPMDKEISDELFWNLRIRDALVKIGLEKGLKISSYDPEERNIDDANDPRTNWSVGSEHSRKGGYVIEIHFDSYGEYGFGSGLIPPMTSNLNTLDESLAKQFGRFPLFFRGGLGGPRRQIRILEVGKLEGSLESKLRNKKTREKTINEIAKRIMSAMISGLK